MNGANQNQATGEFFIFLFFYFFLSKRGVDGEPTTTP
jgi:hypothetical protein